MKKAAFEIYGRGFGWAWRLRDRYEIIAHCGQHKEDARDLREDIDRTRRAIAQLTWGTDPFPEDRAKGPQIVVEEEPEPGGDDEDPPYVWRLETSGEVLAYSARQFETPKAAEASAERFLEAGAGSVPAYMADPEREWVTEAEALEVAKPGVSGPINELMRGPRHREALESFDTRIVVAGSRGKSSTVRWLDDIFTRRGFETFTKITGDHPIVVRNGRVHAIERKGPRTTLYENTDLVEEFAPRVGVFNTQGVAIFENQGITGYTSRLVHERFVDPNVILLTNVRQDHKDTLGRRRQDIARALARSVPEGTHVVNGEQHDALYDYSGGRSRRGAPRPSRSRFRTSTRGCSAPKPCTPSTRSSTTSTSRRCPRAFWTPTWSASNRNGSIFPRAASSTRRTSTISRAPRWSGRS